MRNGEVNVFCCFKCKKTASGTLNMGSSQSNKAGSPPSVEFPRTHNVRASIRTKIPMPEQSELERRFTKVLASMDLPPDKAKLLKQYDNERKWEIICDQERVHAKDPPSHYLSKLRTYLDPKASRSSRKRKMVGDATSTQVLRDLEISLRTNHIEWVREFLNDENHGLDSLIDYLSFRLVMMRHEQFISESRNTSEEHLTSTYCASGIGGGATATATCLGNVITTNGNGSYNNSTLIRPTLDVLDSPSIRRQSRHAAKLNMGDTKDDIHVCIMCLRAIMNNKVINL